MGKLKDNVALGNVIRHVPFGCFRSVRGSGNRPVDYPPDSMSLEVGLHVGRPDLRVGPVKDRDLGGDVVMGVVVVVGRHLFRKEICLGC